MALGTLIEENIITKPRISTKKCTKTISQPSKKSARWGGLEGEWFSMKNSEPTRPEGTPQIFDPTIKSELLAREGGGGGDLIVGEAPPNNKKSQPLEISQFDDVPIHLMLSSKEITDMEKAIVSVDNNCLSLLLDQEEEVLSHDVIMVEDWIGRCESRTMALQLLNNILEDVFTNLKKTTAPPTPQSGAVLKRNSKATHRLEQIPNIKQRLTEPKSENSKYSRTKIVKKWLET